MGGIFSTPKAPAPPPPPPPPPSRSDADVQAEALAERQRRARAQGRASTVLSGGAGVSGDAEMTPASKALLGQ